MTHSCPEGWHHGLWDTVLDNHHHVDDQAWRQAVDGKQHVGNCRRQGCGGLLVPGVPHRLAGGRWQYPAVCSVDRDHEAAALGPRPAKG